MLAGSLWTRQRGGSERTRPTVLLPHKLLNALRVVLFARIQIAARIDRHGTWRQELAGPTPAAADHANFRQRVAPQDADLLVVAIRHKQIPLLWVVGERDVPHRARRV